MQTNKDQGSFINKIEKELSGILKENYNVTKFTNYGNFDYGICFIIFYKSQNELLENEKQGFNDQVKNIIIKHLKSIGYDKHFPMNTIEFHGVKKSAVRFEFDSDENLINNYSGNMMYRLLDGANYLCIKK